MKKNLLFLFALICSVSLFTACSDDDEPVLPVEKDMAGAYKGELGISINGQSLGSNIPQKIYISKSASGDNQLKLELKAFMFGTMNLGDILVDPCPVTEKDGTYSFTGSQTLTLAAPIGSCPVTVAGTIKDGKISINIGVTVEALQQEVVAKFDGTKLSGSENAEAKIAAFTFENAIVTEQPVIDEVKGTITFKVSDIATDDDLKALTPVITISDKAVVSPASGVAQDFSAGKTVTYTVIAEDGTVKTYVASVAGSQNILKYSFEEWKTIAGSALTNEYVTPLPEDILATSAPGAAFLKLFQIEDLPVFKSADKKEGNYAIKLVTMDTSAKVSKLVPAITSGSVFTGKFDLDVNDRIGSTKFGISYDKKPLRFKGWYKYSPGKKFIDGSKATKPTEVIEIPDKIDECSIVAVLFKVDADDEVLTGHDINTSPKRVAVAVLADGTAKAEYTSFDLPFTFLEGKTYEVGAKYKLAIVCSSSKEGDTFKGAGGSTLILDELEVIGE